VFSLETWFKTTTTTGGRLVGWSNRATGSSTRLDRHLYMDDAGRIRFGVKPDDRRLAIASRTGLNDGQWHHAVGTLSSTGMRLYIDGGRVASRADVTTGEHLSIGTWRLGGDRLDGWPGAPTSGYFAGSLDEVAVYKTELASTRVSAHFLEGTGGTANGKSAPNAAFTKALDGTGKVLTVNGTGSNDPDGGAISTYEWDFGDGATATGATPPAHTYAPGRYDVTLTVTDDEGATDSLTQFVRIMGPPAGSWRVSRVLGRTVNADASLVVDPDGGAIVTYAWNWGDGTPVQAGAVSRPDHVYTADGTYTVTLTATDNEGATSTFALPVTVPNTAPVAVGSVVVDGMTVKVDASGSSDPDGTVASHSWNFGQGLPTIAGATGQYTYAVPGTYRVRLTVTDDDGALTRLDQQVTVPGATTPPPGPTPTTPTPTTPTPTTPGTGTTPLPGQTSKASATLKGKAITKRVRGKVAVRVVWRVVRTGGGVATGTVKVKVGKKTYTGKLRAGKVTIKLGKYAAKGKLKLKAQYGGDATTAGATKVLKVRLR
jgi:PKD repeat protein